MADVVTISSMTDEELIERLAKYGQRVTIKGKMNEAQREIQRKRLNHLEARERVEKEKAEKEAAKLARDSSSPPRKKMRGGRRKTIATTAPAMLDEDEEEETVAKVLPTSQYVESRLPLRSAVGLSPTRSTNTFSQQFSAMSPSHSMVALPNHTDSSPLTVQVMDIASGCPAKRLSLVVSIQDRDKGWVQLAQRCTDEEGRCPGLITKDLFETGIYRIRFETEEYFCNQPCSYPYVEVVFQIEESNKPYHVPLLLTPHSYTTYLNC